MSANVATITGQIPTGPEFDAHIEIDMVALRVGDKVCVTHPCWMTIDRARRTAHALLALADRCAPATDGDER